MPFAKQLYYAEYNGSQTHLPLVILIHGVGSDHLVWPAEIRRMRGFRVIAIDLPGHGRSKGVASHTIEAYTQALFDFIDEIHAFQAVLIGHSMGGAIALQMALEHPKHVRAIGLIASAASFSLEKDFIALFQSEKMLPLGKAELQKKLNIDDQNSDLLSFLERSIKSNRASLWYADWRATAGFDIRNKIKQIEQPAFIAAGTEDRLVTYASSIFLRETLVNAEFHTFYKSGHLFMLQEPQKLSEQLVDFLSRNVT